MREDVFCDSWGGGIYFFNRILNEGESFLSVRYFLVSEGYCAVFRTRGRSPGEGGSSVCIRSGQPSLHLHENDHHEVFIFFIT
jgi:hypothetical protein